MENDYVSKLNGYAHLVAVLRSLESDIGLREFTHLERYIIATLSLDEFRDGARTEAILSHRLLDGATPSSFYRALKKLRDRNLVGVVGNRKTGVYRITI